MAPTTQQNGLRSSVEDELISLSKQFNAAFGNKDLSKLDGLLSPNVVFHADKVIFELSRLRMDPHASM